MIRKTMLETVPARASSPGCSARMIKFASPPSEVMLEAPGVRREPLFEGVMRFRCRRSRTLWNGARRLHRFHRLSRSIVGNMGAWFRCGFGPSAKQDPLTKPPA